MDRHGHVGFGPIKEFAVFLHQGLVVNECSPQGHHQGMLQPARRFRTARSLGQALRSVKFLCGPSSKGYFNNIPSIHPIQWLHHLQIWPKIGRFGSISRKDRKQIPAGILGEVNFYLVGPYMALQLNATRLLRMEHQSWPQTCQDLVGPHLTCRTTSCMKVGMLWCVAWKSKTFTTQGLPSYLAAGMVKSLRTIHHT